MRRQAGVRSTRSLVAVAAALCALMSAASAFVVPVAPRTTPLSSSRSSAGPAARRAARPLQQQQQRRQTVLAALGPEVYVAADLGKIVSDEIYGPMFFQALLLSVSGFLAAAALAAVIIFKGDALTTELLNEAYEERDSLRQRVGASEDKDGTIVVGFGNERPQNEAPAVAAAPPVEDELRKEKELVGVVKGKGPAAAEGGGAAVNDFED